ncbi:glucokinase [Megalodesulfovibrio paquesii]
MAERTDRILAADIGGTSSRFGCFVAFGDELALEATLVLPTGNADSFTDLLQQAVAQEPALEPADMDAAAFAVPGAVRGTRPVHLPNIAWQARREEMQAAVPGAVLVILNDFAAQAHAVRTPVMAEAELLKPGEAYDLGPVAVTGAGTGLGNCALLPLPDGDCTVVPSEIGHAPFPFQGKEEFAFQSFLARQVGVAAPIGDHVVSGSGLVALHAFFTGEMVHPWEVAEHFERVPQVVEWFARFYGRACRQYALAVVASGGSVISGGVAARHPILVRHPNFLASFLDCPSQLPLLEAIPIRRNANELSGLWGAAHAGLQALRAGSPGFPPGRRGVVQAV